MGYESSEHHPAFEEYSETIWELAEGGTPVIQARIAERLGVSRPAVSEMVRRMQREGLVEIASSGEIALTVEGRELASVVVRRHRLAERFLTDVLGLNWEEAHHEAGRWEHVISNRVEDAMMEVLKNPTTCPHGNPIPGSGYSQPEHARPLGDVDVGDGFTIERISEELEFQRGQLSFLEGAGLIPGHEGSVLSISPDGTTTISIDGGAVGISEFAAGRIVVSVPHG